MSAKPRSKQVDLLSYLLLLLDLHRHFAAAVRLWLLSDFDRTREQGINLYLYDVFFKIILVDLGGRLEEDSPYRLCQFAKSYSLGRPARHGSATRGIRD